MNNNIHRDLADAQAKALIIAVLKDNLEDLETWSVYNNDENLNDIHAIKNLIDYIENPQPYGINVGHELAGGNDL